MNISKIKQRYRNTIFNTFNKGFSLLEIVIVVTIILILASLVMVSLEESREKARNTAKANQIREYQKVFNMHYSDHGNYPNAGPTYETGQSCLGDFATNACWNNVTEKAWLEAAIIPGYMSLIPPGDTRPLGDQSRTGMLYQYSQFGKEYKVFYMMEGKNRDCLIDHTIATPSGNDTLCTLTVTP